MNKMSQEEDLFHNVCTFNFSAKIGIKDQAILYQLGRGPVGYSSETEYDEFNKIFYTRYATFSELLTVLRKLYILYENSSIRASVFASEKGLF